MNKISNKINKQFTLIAGLLIISFWFRIQGFLYSTFAFTYDVGRDMLALDTMSTTHKPLLIGATTGMHGVFYGPTWYYLLFPFFVLFRGDPRGIALVMALSGVLTALFAYFLGKNIGGKVMGTVMLILVGVSQVLTEISTQIWNPNFIPLFIVLFLFLLTSKSFKSKPYTALLIGLILGVIFDLEIVFGILFLVSAVGYYVLFERKDTTLRSAVLIFVGFLFIQLPRLFFELRHDFLMTRTFLNSLGASDGSHLLTAQPRIVNTFNALLSVWSNTIACQQIVIGGGMLLIVIAGLFITYSKLKAHEKKFLGFLIVTPLVYFLGLSFFNHDIESHYYIGLPLIFLLILSFAISTCYIYIKKSLIILVVVVVLFACSINQLKLLNTFQKSNWIGDSSVYRNQTEIIDYIYHEASHKKFNYIVYTPPIFDYPYQYLFKWYAVNKYGYQPEKSAQKLLFVILEPDVMPDRQKAWLEIRKDDGKIVKEKTFKSGIIVQTRSR